MQVIRNIFGVLEPRTGKLTFSENALEKMKEAGLDTARLKDAFRYGSEIKENTIVLDYTSGVVEIVIKPDESTNIDGRFIVISCEKWDCD
jgi:hypothetical protein